MTIEKLMGSCSEHAPCSASCAATDAAAATAPQSGRANTASPEHAPVYYRFTSTGGAEPNHVTKTTVDADSRWGEIAPVWDRTLRICVVIFVLHMCGGTLTGNGMA